MRLRRRALQRSRVRHRRRLRAHRVVLRVLHLLRKRSVL